MSTRKPAYLRPRPAEWLTEYARRYPGAWRQYDAFRASPPEPWPTWCFCPLAAAYAIVTGGRDEPPPPERRTDVGALGALAAWRATQGIYRYDADVLAAVAGTSLADDRDLPAHALLRLPEWCVYIEAPGLRVCELHLEGFFAHLEHDPGNGRAELRLVLDADDPLRGGRRMLVPVPLHLVGSLADGVRAMGAEARRNAAAEEAQFAAVATAEVERNAQALAPLVALVLYLCSEEPDLNGEPLPARPRPTQTKRGPRLFPPDAPRVWDVGVRVGAALRAAIAQTQAEPASSDADGTERAAVRPHLRRAHWHTYLHGVGRTERRVRWMPPILVAATDSAAGGIVPTVRPVH